MTEHAKISPEGEAIIPKEVCERLNWHPGTEIEFEAGGGAIVIRSKPAPRERISWEEFRRRVPPHDGPPVSIEEMNLGIEEERAKRWARKERRSR